MRPPITLCNCVLTPKRNSLGLAALETLSRSYQSGLRELVHSGRYDTRDDFTVVLQPFFQNLILPVGQDGRPDICYFAADCLLPSQRLHTQLARALWNNMMAPLGNKKDFLNLEIEMPLFCPDPNMPYVRTIKNSNYTYPGNPVDKNWGSEFNCKDLKPSKSVPTSVHKLRPADINVVATMGDWITTAWGASPTNISASFTSWRGLSWSIGGDRGLRNQTTLPNILKQFNARLYGSSTGTWKDMAGLNVAKENARAPNLVYQAEELVKLMENISEINSHDNWKLITIFIGINDLCDYCNTLDENAATAYFEGIKTALDVLSLKLSRVFINLVQLMKMTDLYLNYSKLCKPPTLPVFSCPCLSIFSDSFKLGKLMIMNKNFQSAIRKLSSLKEYQNRENFTVVMQPFLQNITIPQNKEGMKSDSFFTEDCFHFSARTHDQMAIALWNNMLESVDSKSTNSDFGSNKNKLICPTPEHPFFFTARKRKTTVTVKIKDAKKRSWRFWLLITLLFLLFIIIVCFLVERYFEKKETNMYMKAKKRKMKHGKAKPLENTEPKEETP
ncbi:phospholipase B1, membrane-associated-like [Erinaceus europaeus]|uniref:Phospholipase B1, membrane-associated-like n=1 Tax=Erinaceus europaeus TaxID=9365 RepID=A0ABM3X6G3_ERIEU|nr:phospholipase B1, membrane-associated-like [Erinaceus europaeus]